MTLKRLLGWGTLLLVLALAAPRTSAAPILEGGAVKVLAEVPADAPVVLKLHGVEHTKDRLLAMLKNALPDLQPKVAEEIDKALKNLPQGRELKGLDKDAPIFLFLTELPDPTEMKFKVGLLVGVTNYEAFRDGILIEEERKGLKKGDGYESTTVNDNMPLYFVDRVKEIGYVVVASDKDAALSLAKKPSKGLDSKLSGDLAKKMISSDFALYVDMTAVNKKYGETLKAFRDSLEGILSTIPNIDKDTQDLIKRVGVPVFQAIGDAELFLVSVEFRPEGLAVSGLGEVGAKTKTNDLLKEAKPTSLVELDKLPAGMLAYSAMQLQSSLFKDFGSLLFGVAPPDGDKKDDAALKAAKEAMEGILAAKPKLMLNASKITDGSVAVSIYEDPARAVESSLKLYQSVKGSGNLFTTPLKGDPIVKAKAEKYQGFEFNYVSVTWDLDKLAEKQSNPALTKEQTVEYLKATMGETQNQWIGTDGKVVLTVTAKDFAAAKVLIDDYLKGTPVGSDPSFQAARKQVPADTTLLVLVDLPRTTVSMLKMMKPLLENIPGAPTLEEPKEKPKPAFMALALTMQPQRGSFDLFISVQVVSELYKMYGKALTPKP